MAWTESDLESVNRAIRLGAVSVRYADRTVTYRSLDELRSIKREIEQALGVETPSRRRYGQYGSGL
jgi:hypothetical protein